MNLLVDENLGHVLVDHLRDSGHCVELVSERTPSADDVAVLRLANERNSVLLTEDKDFGELAFRQRLVHGGIMLVRLFGLSEQSKAAIVCEVLRERGEEMRGAFTVVTPGLIRIRRRQDPE